MGVRGIPETWLHFEDLVIPKDMLVIPDVSLQPGFRMPVRGIGCDDHVFFVIELDDGLDGTLEGR